MAYTPQTWTDAAPGVAGSVANAARLGTIEAGIAAAHATADGVNTRTSNVDNTADTDKPISSATQTALNAKVSAAVTNGTFSVEYSTGNWTGNPPPSRVNGATPWVFIGTHDPADATNGVDTPANIRTWDVWIGA